MKILLTFSRPNRPVLNDVTAVSNNVQSNQVPDLKRQKTSQSETTQNRANAIQ
jgi:hypothetical protein